MCNGQRVILYLRNLGSKVCVPWVPLTAQHGRQQLAWNPSVKAAFDSLGAIIGIVRDTSFMTAYTEKQQSRDIVACLTCMTCLTYLTYLTATKLTYSKSRIVLLYAISRFIGRLATSCTPVPQHSSSDSMVTPHTDSAPTLTWSQDTPSDPLIPYI